MQSVPTHLEVAELKKKIEKVKLRAPLVFRQVKDKAWLYSRESARDRQ